MVMKIAFLEQQLKSLAIGGKFKDLALAGDIREWHGCSKAKSVAEFLTEVEQCAKVSNWSDIDIVIIV
jgi:hypothetical protein